MTVNHIGVHLYRSQIMHLENKSAMMALYSSPVYYCINEYILCM